MNRAEFIRYDKLVTHRRNPMSFAISHNLRQAIISIFTTLYQLLTLQVLPRLDRREATRQCVRGVRPDWRDMWQKWTQRQCG